MSAPAPLNRPGLDALTYRAGTYGTFMRAMTERLNARLPALTTRELDDPAIALLDGWAIVADVLTFYQERIANEGYVRTAVDKFSVLQFADLVGYTPRPGVAASVFLAYTLEKGGDVTLPAGSKAQSVPGPGETPQAYEIANAFAARDVWNTLPLRTTQPQNPGGTAPFYLSTITTNLKPNDMLLFVRNGSAATDALPEHRFVRIAAVEPQPAQNRTKITLQGAGLDWSDAGPAPADEAAPPLAAELPDAATPASTTLLERMASIEPPLLRRPSAPPRSPQRLARTPAEALGPNLDLAPQLFAALHPGAAKKVYSALANAPATPQTPLDVYAFRVRAAPYGHNAPAPPVRRARPTPEPGLAAANPEERVLQLVHALFAAAAPEEGAVAPDWPLAFADRDPTYLSLDARYDRIAPGTFVGVRTFPNDEPVLFSVVDTRERSRRDYGLSAATTVLTLNTGYFVEPGREQSLAPLRDVDVFAQSERLQLADVPIAADIPDDPAATPTVLELDGIYDGLAPGRWAIIAGTRTDLPGVVGAELVMIAATEHRANPALPGDTLHTFVTLSAQLAYRYARSSVTVWGNVVRATHGETRTETIGSGDASQARQSFALKAKSLTFVASPTQSGTQSTLTVRVNGVPWAEAGDLNALGPTDRAYTTATNDSGTTVTFGDGVHGARLPTGTENVSATYRTGLGAPGNVDSSKISLLMSRPLGVKAVGNPLPASGGTDPESRDDIRRNLATALLALDRLVSLDDYANFARTFAGVAKAAVASIGTGAAGTVCLTLAGAGGAAIDPNGDLANNLATALRTLGDPRQAFTLAGCDRVLLLVGANVDLAPDAVWETVEPAIRAALGDTFGFNERDFGRPAHRSEAIAAIAGVPGVVDVALDLFTGISAATLGQLPALQQQPVVDDVVTPLPARRSGDGIAPAQLVVLDPSVADTVLLRKNAGGAPV
jgi:hypothetical protein